MTIQDRARSVLDRIKQVMEARTPGPIAPCPFCGFIPSREAVSFGSNQGTKWGFLTCPRCAAQGPEVRTNYQEWDVWCNKAIKEWNQRAGVNLLPALVMVMEGDLEILGAMARFRLDNGTNPVRATISSIAVQIEAKLTRLCNLIEPELVMVERRK
jgi:hypothetical protein